MPASAYASAAARRRLRPAVELGQQHPQDRRLELVQARVVAHVLERPLVARAVEPQRARQLRDAVIVGRDRAAVAEAGEVLGGVERERGHVAERSGAPAVEARARGLGGILQYRQPELADLGRGRGCAEQVDGDDRLGPGRQHRADRVGGHVTRRRIDVAEHRTRSGVDDRLGGCVERERRHHDLVVAANPERPQRDRDRVGAVADADRVAHTEVGRELLLERPDLRAEDVLAPLHDSGDPLENRGPERQQRRVGVEQPDRHQRQTLPGG